MSNPSRARTNENMTDEQFVLSAREGDSSAMAALISRMAPLVKARSSFYDNGVLDPEDLAQEGMIGLLSAIRNFDECGGAAFRTFAGVCIGNRILSAIRAASRQKHIPLNNYVSLSDDNPGLSTGNADNPEDMLISREEAANLDEILAESLSKFEFKVLKLYLGGRSYDEIATRLGSTAKSVDNALQRVRRKMRFLAKGQSK